ncbi:hypothetical protein [Pseudoduganella sp.]|uniref:hypothetical protein n=1 Tax=Pseudoduganella sp. TaxID=1880898 RepID=UPI0035AE3F66
MDRLISYRPELELAPAAAGAAWRDNSLAQAAELLSARREGRLAQWMRRAAPALGDVLAPLASEVLSAGPAAARMLGLELEGLSAEDREFETARQFMRFAGLASRRARQAARGDPRQVRRAALALAARSIAPGLMPALTSIMERTSALPSAVSPEREHIMHDIDRTTLEFGNEASNYEGEYEFGEAEWGGETGQQGMLTEAEEMELASELLSVTNEAELDQFLGSFLKKAANFAGNVIRSPVGQAIGGALKGVAKKAIPLAGGAIGGYFGGPLGAKIGSGLASAAGSALGLEAEGEFQSEDREFEGARTFVKMAADTVSRAAQTRGGDPRQVAMQAATAAARQFAPGLLGRNGAQGGQFGQQGGQYGQQGGQFGQQGGAGRSQGAQQGAARGGSGRWVRQGRKIVIYGA